MTLRLFLLLSIIGCMAVFFPRTGMTADPLADKVQARYASLQSMRADFTQVLLHKESGGEEERSGTLYFKKPLLLRWDTAEPVPELLVVGSDGIWNSFPDEELAYKYPASLAEDSASLVRVITGQARLDQDFMIEREADEDGLAKLLLYPKEPTTSVTEVVLWVDAGSGLIKRLRIYDFYSNENDIRFTSQESDIVLADSLFHYTPPEGFTVEDRTDSGAIENRLLQ